MLPERLMSRVYGATEEYELVINKIFHGTD